MDLKRIDKIVSDYVKDKGNKLQISTLDVVNIMSQKVLTENLDDYETNKWSRNFDINDSIKIVSSYIKSIDDKMFQSFNEEIKNAENLLKVITNENNPIKKSIFLDEANDKRRVNQISEKGILSFPKSQRYVIAYVLTNEILKHENVKDEFLKLHYEVGNDNSNIHDIFDYLLNSYPSLR